MPRNDASCEALLNQIYARASNSRPAITDTVRNHCKSLATTEAVVLEFRLLGKRYKAGFCHANVMHAVRERGGARVFGWLIWTCCLGFVEGEFHSVWRTPDGDLVDVTPRVDREKRVRFLPDPERCIEHLLGDDLSWANRTNQREAPFRVFGCPYEHERYIILRSRRLANHLQRLGFPRDQSLA